MIVITGPSGSGKTFLANKLQKDINNAIVINTDSYYRANLFVKFLSLFMKDFYDRLISVKLREISKTISSIHKNEKAITFYKYDFKRKKSTQSIKKADKQTKYLIIEGIFSHRIDLNYKRTLNILYKETKEICYQRRLKRDELERGRNKKDVSRKFTKSWDLYYKNLNSFINKNDIYELKSIDSKSYKRLIKKITEIDSHKKKPR